MTERVWLVQGADYDAGWVVGVFATKEEADRECERCYEARRYDGSTEDYFVTEWALGESLLMFLVRINAQGDVTDARASTFFDQTPEGRVYESVHDDGSAFDAFGPTYEEALALARKTAGLDAGGSD